MAIFLRCMIKRLMSRVAAREKSVTDISRSAINIDKLDIIPIKNEPVLRYLKGSPELQELQEVISALIQKSLNIPIIIDGSEYMPDIRLLQIIPHSYRKNICMFYHANKDLINFAAKTATKAQVKWDRTDLSERIKIWEKAAELMSKKYRAELVASTMLGQSKTLHDAEQDVATLIDFILVNTIFLRDLARYKPFSPNPSHARNFMKLRGLEGFVAAISPFNSTAIGGNLAYTPALMGNAVIWKPSDGAILSNWCIFNIFREAGLPDGVVNFVPADGPQFATTICESPHLTAINYTGSMRPFSAIWKLVGENINVYKNFPRLVGECGGKNFHFVHPSADVSSVVACTTQSAFQYNGQNCSASSILYVPESLWESQIKTPLIDTVSSLKVGDVSNMEVFGGAIINENAFRRLSGLIKYAEDHADCDILFGGHTCSWRGYFVEPTIIKVKDIGNRLLNVETMGPILCVYVYADNDIDNLMDQISKSSYGLTATVFSKDIKFTQLALEKFKYNAGSIFINDKSTEAMVGQQPFGGARLSGTNDKAGSPHYLIRWTSLQSIKETYVPMTDVYYDYMKEVPKHESE